MLGDTASVLTIIGFTIDMVLLIFSLRKSSENQNVYIGSYNDNRMSVKQYFTNQAEMIKRDQKNNLWIILLIVSTCLALSLPLFSKLKMNLLIIFFICMLIHYVHVYRYLVVNREFVRKPLLVCTHLILVIYLIFIPIIVGSFPEIKASINFNGEFKDMLKPFFDTNSEEMGNEIFEAFSYNIKLVISSFLTYIVFLIKEGHLTNVFALFLLLFMLMSLLFRNSILNYILYTRILVLLVALLIVFGSVWILINTKVVVPIQTLGFVFILLLLAYDDKRK
ncbi:hypothetical protein IGM_05758 [Bacillus cereus HuB4-4]|uniref:Uncharacterized protein n=1 Tax=Bacillus cereus HuB4-4 TaxID=1053211 RepID=A0A9W5QPT7_BACCE|nr:hypothetical protein [Bacillus cereus]EOP81032.1 hypothetical protein IGM_05758 [Bacillus cereus HuB4-4]